MLISAPGDVPDEDMSTVKRTVSQWNWNTGRPSGMNVVPVSWSEHAAAEFGERPQAVLNGQMVGDADMALALFADRLGTPTGAADSGTLEEIERLVDAGKHVSVLVNRGPRALSGTSAVEEKGRLEKALDALRKRAIVLPYADQAMLVGHVNNMLSMAAGQVAATVDSAPAREVPADAIGVWPHYVSESYQETDSKGRLRTRSKHFIELRNETGRPVLDVVLSIPEDMRSFVHNAGEVINRMPPGGTYRFQWSPALGSVHEGVATATWHFDGDEPRESTATIRL